jgi:YD repeat-containing protein
VCAGATFLVWKAQEDNMKITYDEKADALYIAFGEGPAAVEEVAEGIALDWDAEGKLLGIEILDASKRVANPGILKRWSQEG